MKRIVTLLFFGTMVFWGTGKAQSLDFSQVLLISSVEDTVPVGKVWKVVSLVTSAVYQNTNGGCASTTNGGVRGIFLNGSLRYLQSEAVATSNSSLWFTGNSLPFWLPAGTRLRTNCSGVDLSVIEFTVVP